MTLLLAAVGLLSVFSSVVNAIPINIELRDVFVPPITYPHAGTHWYSGQTHNVTWDTSNAPKQITNKVGKIILRFDDISSPLILAENFDILLGRIEVAVPLLESRSDYQLVLFGDSGNFSPDFSIN
ncbi:hypothetical protein PLICRDRAFT_33734 [Plicaturopsis crispa FD-325 SS-3]|nr:hypothetical protein PLICRDRAFT_33734 [Plicaturopsis crispa FD-325 SS-3]